MQEPKARQYEPKTNAEFVVSRLAPQRSSPKRWPRSLGTQNGS
jgi:hypothetical protein